MKYILNIAAYKFIKLENLPQWQASIKAACQEGNLKGTILLAPEGINIMLSGAEADIRGFISFLTQQAPFTDLYFKESYSATQSFKCLFVKIKKEIIAFGVPEVDPATFTAPRLPPEVFKQWLDEGKDVTILDTRNVCEISMGAFKNAVDLKLDHFRNFPKALQQLGDEAKSKPIVTYCTGGIRCEKAAAYMLQQGFQEVYQLEGGILEYFAKCGDAHYSGECFVFDERVRLDGQLQPTTERQSN